MENRLSDVLGLLLCSVSDQWLVVVKEGNKEKINSSRLVWDKVNFEAIE